MIWGKTTVSTVLKSMSHYHRYLDKKSKNTVRRLHAGTIRKGDF